MKYVALIAGGRGPDAHDFEATVDAETMYEAVAKLYDEYNLHHEDADILEIELIN